MFRSGPGSMSSPSGSLSSPESDCQVKSTRPSSPQSTVLARHRQDQESADRFIQERWPVPEVRASKVDMDSIITYAVSTTSGSSLLLIAKGSRSMFTRNSYSKDSKNPWLISQNFNENQGLAQHVQEEWGKMAVHSNGSRAEVDKIAAHVLYQKQNSKWVFVPFSESGSSNVVRFRVGDVEIWSHPPRDEALMAALKEMEEFNRAVGDLKQSAEALKTIKGNTKIPPDKKPQAVQTKLDEIAQKFSVIYECYTKVKIPESFQWPTLQLGQTNQRYGGTFAGVYKSYANEVHMRFHAPDVKIRKYELPTKQTIFYSFLPHEKFNLNFEDVIES